MESEDNVVMVCKDCSEEAKKQFQKTFDKNKLGVNDFVKIPLEEDEEVEHMWVIITKLNKKTFNGILNNEPFVLKGILLGDEIRRIPYTEIEAWDKNE